ncbi:Hint domain-containing protein [Rhodobacteraceae bacterium M385]|nr:Hint domain-containing protein [Rhodobacteraceae bacterium M385]
MQFTSQLSRSAELRLDERSEASEPIQVPTLPKQAFAAQTPIQTEQGFQALSELSVGQRVLTRLGTLEPITEIEHFHFTKRQLHDMPEAAPVRFDPNALPSMTETSAILISADCPVSWAEDPNSLTRFPAKAFCDGGLIRRVIPEEGIHFIRLHLPAAQQICAGGIWVELDADRTSEVAFDVHVPQLVQDIRIFRPIPA